MVSDAQLPKVDDGRKPNQIDRSREEWSLFHIFIVFPGVEKITMAGCIHETCSNLPVDSYKLIAHVEKYLTGI